MYIQVRVVGDFIALQGSGWIGVKKVRRALLAVSCLLRAALSQTFWRWRGLAVWGSGTEGLRRKKLQVRGERVENGMAERMGTLLSGSQDLSSQGDFGK